VSTRKPTSLDIAYLAGVSQSTVSRALRGSELVSRQTRERIMEVAKQLNYRIDRNAANLRSQRTQTLALLLFEDPTSDESHINPFFLALLGSISRAASKRGYDLLVSFQHMSEDWYTEYELANRADGIILLGYGDYTEYNDKLQTLIDAEAHFVIWGPIIEESGRYLSSDNFAGGLAATEHLLGLGRRRIAFFGEASEGSPEFQQRFEGYRHALAAAGVPFDPALHVAGRDYTEAAGIQGVEDLIEAGVEVDAIFSASDLMALGAIQALRRHGLKIPADVSVVGFDDIPAASYANPPLTTVHQDTLLAGQMLVENLIALIDGQAIEYRLVPPNLIIRRSCSE
jgi:DNA-binding LacI/PurR family transcriptional regulator